LPFRGVLCEGVRKIAFEGAYGFAEYAKGVGFVRVEVGEGGRGVVVGA
jgi:hypothetical protein